MEELEEKLKNMKASELMDYYPSVSDDDSITFMDEFWNRFPFDVWDDEIKELRDSLEKHGVRIKELEKQLNLQTRVLDRIDRLTKAISGRKK